METSNYVKLNDSRFIIISGEDKRVFLQDLITNDINKCNNSKAIYACLLSPQGKFLSDFFIIQNQKEYLIEINKKFVENFLMKLNLYKLRSKINIEIKKDLTSLVILESKESVYRKEKLISFNDPRNKKIGIKIFIKQNKINELISKFNLNEINFNYYRELLIKNLIPYSSEDLLINKSLLLENNFEKLNAIDWEKGCYIGQEITARMKYRALLKKSIRSLKIISGNVEIDNKIYYKDNVVGKIISSFNNLAIGMMNINEAKIIWREDKIIKTESSKLKIIY